MRSVLFLSPRRSRFIFWAVFFIFLFLHTVPAQTMPPMSLGLYVIENLDPAVWTVDEHGAVNHWVSLAHQKTGAAALISIEALTLHERKLEDDQAMIAALSTQWLDWLKSKNTNVRLSNQAPPTGAEFQAGMVLIASSQTKDFRIYRFYRLIPGQSLVLTFTFEVPDAGDNEEAMHDFHGLGRSIRIDETYDFSPCERMGLMAKQFQRLRESQGDEPRDESTLHYISDLKKEAAVLSQSDPHAAMAAKALLQTLTE